MIGRGPPFCVRSVPRAITEGRALGRHVLTDPAQILTQQLDLIHALIMLTLSTSVRAILSHLDRHHALTELPGQLIQIITEIGAVMIRDLLPRSLSSLMHRIDPALETSRECLELHRDDATDRYTESRERGHDLWCRHDGHERVCCWSHWSPPSRGVGVVTSSHQSIRPVGLRAV